MKRKKICFTWYKLNLIDFHSFVLMKDSNFHIHIHSMYDQDLLKKRNDGYRIQDDTKQALKVHVQRGHFHPHMGECGQIHSEQCQP